MFLLYDHTVIAAVFPKCRSVRRRVLRTHAVRLSHSVIFKENHASTSNPKGCSVAYVTAVASRKRCGRRNDANTYTEPLTQWEIVIISDMKKGAKR